MRIFGKSLSLLSIAFAIGALVHRAWGYKEAVQTNVIETDFAQGENLGLEGITKEIEALLVPKLNA